MPGDGLYVERDYARLRPGFAKVRDSQWTPSAEARAAMQSDLKLRLQVRLEREIVAFERSLANGFRTTP
jgi:hypothetical protein